jgi:predicted N-acetyltransferase YhbS
MIAVGVFKQELSAIEAFYAQCGYRGDVAPDDIIVTATDGKRIVGVVRLCSEHGVTVLRGMEIAPGYQRQGIGTQMLDELDKLIGKKECWVIALVHLQTFYGRIGFRFIGELKAPPHLVSRIVSYRSLNQAANNGKENIIMIRAAQA